jgi:uncharacterized protein
MIKVEYLALILFAVSGTATAASFDCGEAATLVEEAICSDQQLSNADDALASAYRSALVAGGADSLRRR